MAETRWKRLESLFHEALPLFGEEREKFLESACHGDPDLYQELSSLLKHYRGEDELLESPAAPSLRQDTRLHNLVFSEGQHAGPYEILALLGRGGMGEVYLARDPRLGRKAAIKVLPSGIGSNPAVIEQLKREAQAASALNHPNILTIYDFGQQGEVQYMVSEFVEGDSLRSLIGTLDNVQAMHYARQTGEALKSAHAAGIVHRDIKPENIMVRSDGYIKVLDFGLAKLNTLLPDSGKALTDTPAKTVAATIPGLLIGTINYMSPEQVRGKTVDHRTDIWSWGVVLYEMAAGRRPFEGETAGDVVAAILGKEPDAPTQNHELNRIIFRCLAKERDQRYSTMREALLELARVQEVSAGAERFFFRQQFQTVKKPLKLSVVLLLMAAAALAAYFVLRPGTRLVSSAHPFRVDHAVPITAGANVVRLAVSGDGNYVAYASEEKDGQVLRLHQLGTGAFIKLRPAIPDRYAGISFSTDSKFIYYVVDKNKFGTLYRIPLLGGTPEFLVSDVDSPVSFSPDGKQFVFLRIDMQNQQASLMLSSADGRSTGPLFVFHNPEYAFPAPLWSPDGRSILCGTMNDSGDTRKIQFKVIQISDMKAETIGPEPWSTIHKPAWLKRGRTVAVAASPIGSNFPRIFELSLADGHISPISREALDYTDLASTPNSDELIAIQWRRESSLWIVDLRRPGNVRAVSTPGRKLYDINWPAPGKVVSQVDVEGRPDLWEINTSSGDSRQLTFDSAVDLQPVISHDGKVLIYVSDMDGTFHLWKKAVEGGRPVRLTSSISLENQPVITPDDRWVIYTSTQSGRQALWKVPLQGGTPIQLTQAAAREAAVSPDGKLVACGYADGQSQSGWSIAVLDANTFHPLRFFHDIPADDGAIPVRWSPDGKYLLYVQTVNGVSNIWKQPVDGGVATQMTHFKEERIFAFALSPDGTALACLRGTRISDAVLLKSGN